MKKQHNYKDRIKMLCAIFSEVFRKNGNGGIHAAEKNIKGGKDG
jgi:hypothetical protein